VVHLLEHVYGHYHKQKLSELPNRVLGTVNDAEIVDFGNELSALKRQRNDGKDRKMGIAPRTCPMQKNSDGASRNFKGPFKPDQPISLSHFQDNQLSKSTIC